MSEGIFYIAYGESHYFREIKRSVESLRKHCDLPIAIFTDRDFQIDGCMSFLIETDIEYRAQPKSTDRFRLKLELLKELPFKRTVYVDTDTLFLDDPSKLFENNYDIAICRETRFRSNPEVLPSWFNTGFFVANRNEQYENLMDKAIFYWDEFDAGRLERPKDSFGDQFFINHAITRDLDLTLQVLPQKWNVRRPLLGIIEQPSLIHCHKIPEEYLT